MDRTDRRTAIAEAALDLAAESGTHAVTHAAVDRRLGLAKGSTSYYCRTRQSLIDSATEQLVQRSRDAFAELLREDGNPVDVITRYVLELLATRGRDVRARYALVTAAPSGEAGADLSACFFSASAAQALMTSRGAADPAGEAVDLITVLEGLLFTYIAGHLADRTPSVPAIRRLLDRTLRPDR